MLSLKRIASQLKASDRLTDYTNLGQDQMTEAFLYPLMQNIPYIRIDTRDFEGDLISSAVSGVSPEFPDYLLKNSFDGQQIEYFQVTNGKFWYSYATQIGDQDHIADLLILHKNLDSILANLSHQFSGIWLSVVSQDQPDYSQAPSGFKKFINEFKLNHRKPPNRLTEGVFESHTSVILPEPEYFKGAFSFKHGIFHSV